MRDRRKRGDVGSWSRFFCFTLFVVASCILITGFTFSSFRIFGESFRPVLKASWESQAMEAVSDDSAASPDLEIRETVVFPDQVLAFLEYPPSTPLFTTTALDCAYLPPNSSEPQLKLPPLAIDTQSPSRQMVRCPIGPRGFSKSLAVKLDSRVLPSPQPYSWESLVYEAVIDRDNTTVVFVKGLRLRPGRLSDPSRYECVYGWNFNKPRLMLRSQAISAAQEVVRCATPLSVLSRRNKSSIKVSVRIKGWGSLHSVARLDYRLKSDLHRRKRYDMCVCTMVRNQARFLREWIMYHGRIGVARWFIYDNNSEDALDEVIDSLHSSGYKITRHAWPWVKTQEAGFAHCALRSREACEWVAFIDVDEFLHFPSGLRLSSVIGNRTEGFDHIGEIRVSCHSFGPSGLKKVPAQGVSIGYTCRLASPERHKSIVRPEALNSSLITVVHHFELSDDFDHLNMDRSLMVINHYKYQVWDVFKEKFYRRVATYVEDWKNERNVGSKDRAPGLGTQAVEPLNWSTRFCEVNDLGLRTVVLHAFADRGTKRLPWQTDEE